MPRKKSPEIPDQYVGKVYGNILDQYDNPTYNLKLYVKPVMSKSSGAAPAADDSSSGDDARSDTPTDGTQTIVVTGKKPISSDSQQIIIAQTGVTGVTIDDLEFKTTPSVTGLINNDAIRDIKFTLIQPGAANLIDQIQYARQYIGELNNPTGFFLWLDISFLGYESDPDDNEKNGEQTVIAGPYTIQMVVQDFQVQVDQTGSKYFFTCMVEGDIGYADVVFKTPFAVISKGKTIKEHVDSFVANYNKYIEENYKSYEKPDVIKIDLSDLLGTGEDKISDDKVITGNDPTAQSINQATMAGQAAQNAEEREQIIKNTGKAQGKDDFVIEADQITIPEGTTIYDYIAMLLSMNKEFINKGIVRKENFDDPGSDSVNEDQSVIKWFKVESKTKILGWDKTRRAYTREYTYIPYITNSARSDVLLTLKELDQRSDPEKLATRRLQDVYAAGMLQKAYYYLFTGKNDQILNLDISYNTVGTALLLPPKGGMTGDISITAAPSLTPTLPANKDASLKDLFNKAKDLQSGNLFKDLLGQLTQTASNLENFASGIGRSADELKAAITDKTGKAAQALVNSLDSATVNRAISSASANASNSDDSSTPTTSTEITQTSSGGYTPELSGFLYAADFVPQESTFTAEELSGSGLIKVENAKPEDTGTPQPEVVNDAVPNPGALDKATYDSTGPSNMLFGYVYRQNLVVNFLQELKMTLRGDPWYIGQEFLPSESIVGEAYNVRRNSTPEQASYGKDMNYLILQIGAPTKFDFIIDDEDSNTGYWGDQHISASFSGLYGIYQATCRFSRGIFTVDIHGWKEIGIPLHLIRPAAEGEQSIKDVVTGDPVASLRDIGAFNDPRSNESPTEGDAVNTDVPRNGWVSPVAGGIGTQSSQQDFGPRTPPKSGASSFHKGIDIAKPAGTPVGAAKAGTIIFAGEAGSYGQVVYIDHGDGTQTRYGHLQEGSIKLAPGTKVSAGQQIGRVGSTGTSTNPHLHFEIRTGQSNSTNNSLTQAVDPRPYVGGGG